MTTMRSAIAAAVERDRGLCVICGRTCGPHEARQRLDPEAAQDSPMNWVAMCRSCQEALAGRMAPPARFVYHVHNTTRLRRNINRAFGMGLGALALATWCALAAVLGWLLVKSVGGFSGHLLSTASAGFLLLYACYAFLALSGRIGPPVQRVHVSHDPQHVRVETK